MSHSRFPPHRKKDRISQQAHQIRDDPCSQHRSLLFGWWITSESAYYFIKPSRFGLEALQPHLTFKRFDLEAAEVKPRCAKYCTQIEFSKLLLFLPTSGCIINTTCNICPLNTLLVEHWLRIETKANQQPDFFFPTTSKTRLIETDLMDGNPILIISTTWKNCAKKLIWFQSQHRWEADSGTILRPIPSASEEERWPALANRTPDKMPHVTSSPAIAPGCLSAQLGGGRRETQGKNRGLGQEQGEERDTETWVLWK